MRLSYVILGRNQCDAMLRTISLLPSITPLPAGQWEVWAVDNGGSDQASEKIAAKFGRVNVLRCETDRDRAAINQAVNCTTGEYVIWLNADTHPLDPRAVRMTLEHMQHRPTTAAVFGKLVLSDEHTLAADFPTVFTPGATCFRRSALQTIGGFDEHLSGVCSDLDLSFRIWQSGLRIERREDILFGRDATLEQAGVEKAEMRDHLILASRYFPAEYRRHFASDWMLRCAAIKQRESGYFQTQKEILRTRLWQLTHAFAKRTPLGDAALEQIFGFRLQSQLIGQWARQHTVWRVVIADFGKNLWASFNACRASGLQIRCITDNHQAFAKMKYRGLPIVPINKAFEGGGIDGVVVSNLNPATIDQQLKSLRHHFKGPILRLWQPSRQAMQSSVAEAA